MAAQFSRRYPLFLRLYSPGVMRCCRHGCRSHRFSIQNKAEAALETATTSTITNTPTTTIRPASDTRTCASSQQQPSNAPESSIQQQEHQQHRGLTRGQSNECSFKKSTEDDLERKKGIPCMYLHSDGAFEAAAKVVGNTADGIWQLPISASWASRMYPVAPRIYPGASRVYPRASINLLCKQSLFVKAMSYLESEHLPDLSITTGLGPAPLPGCHRPPTLHHPLNSRR